MLQQILASHHIQMPLDLRILLSKPLNLVLGESPAETRVELAGQLVVEFRQEFGVEEEVGGGGEFVGHGIEEDFGTVVFVFAGGALFGFYGEEAQAQDVDTVAEEDCFSTWMKSAQISVSLLSSIHENGERMDEPLLSKA